MTQPCPNHRRARKVAAAPIKVTKPLMRIMSEHGDVSVTSIRRAYKPEPVNARTHRAVTKAAIELGYPLPPPRVVVPAA